MILMMFRLDLRDIALGTEDTVDPTMGTRTPRMTNTGEKQKVLLQMGKSLYR